MDYGTTEVVAGVYLAGAPQQRSYSLENPNLPLNDPGIWSAVFGDSWGTDSGVQVTAEKALMYAPFWYGVSMIADDVARLPLPVYKRRPDIADDARERDRGHRLNYILNVAWNEETEAIKGWTRFMVDYLIYQNAYARILYDGTGSPAGLVNLLPDRTHWEYIDGKRFCITEAGGRLFTLFPWEVLYIEGLPLNGIAKPLFQMARNTIALGLAQEKFASKFFQKGGRVGGVLEVPQGMPKKGVDTLEEGFRTKYENTDNAFMTVILRDGSKFHQAQQSPMDSQLVEATEAQTRMIGYTLKLLPSKFGLTNSFSYNSKSEDNQNYLDTTLATPLAKIQSACNFRLISERQSDTHFVEYNTSALLKMDLAKRSDAYQKAIAARWMNPNEVRAKENMLPYEGGDEFVNPNTMKSGNEPGDKEEPDADEPPSKEEPPKRDAAYLRVLFGITARARDKAKRPKAFLEWIDGNLQPHRDEWRHLWGDRAFPFEDLQTQFRSAAEHYPDDKLAAAVEAIATQGESTWNAE